MNNIYIYIYMYVCVCIYILEIHTHTHIYIYIYLYYRLIGLVGSRVFANSLGGLGSIPGHVIPKTLKMVLDTSLLNTQQYKVRIEGKMGTIQ